MFPATFAEGEKGGDSGCDAGGGSGTWGGGRGLAAVAATRAAAATSAAAAPAAVAAAVIADSDENTAAAFFFLLTPLHYSTEYSASQPRVGARQRPLLLVRPRAAVQAASAIAAQKRGTFCLA